MSNTHTLYECDSCGGIMEFDVKTQSLKCPNCDNLKDLTNDKSTIIEHSLEIDDKRKIKAPEKSTSSMICNGCGANIELESHITGIKCPYCGSSYVIADNQMDTLIPDGIIPFKVNKNEVKVTFNNWIKKLWFAPNELKHLYQVGGFQGIYIPYWTFDANSSCYYTARVGKNRTVYYKDEDGNEKTKIEIDWYDISGHVNHFFDDIQVPASSRYKKGFFQEIEPFNFNQLESYSAEYIAGYLSENYSIDLEEGHNEALSIMKKELNSLSRKHAKIGYDAVSYINITPKFYDETYKYLLLPVYSTSYSYKNKTYIVLINGQTNEISGDYPKSWIKITAFILALCALIGFFIYIINY